MRGLQFGAAVIPQVIRIDKHEEEDDDDIVPCGPMAILILVVIGDCRLGVIVSCFKGNTVIAVATWVA